MPLEGCLCLAALDEAVEWIGKPGYQPTHRGTFELAVCSDPRTPRELAEALCAGLQGDPDILDGDIGSQSVELRWTDGVRDHRTWIVDLGSVTLELDYITVERLAPIFDADEVEAMATALFASIRTIDDP